MRSICATAAWTCASGCARTAPSREKAAKQGLQVLDTADAAKRADIIMMLVPDEMGGEIYEERNRAAPDQGQVPRVRPRLQYPFQIHQAARTSTSS